MIDLSNALQSSSSVQVHWEAIADAKYHLHRLPQDKFNRLKKRAIKRHSPEQVDMTWEQALALFNFNPAHPMREYRSSAFQAFLPSSPSI